MNATTVTVAAAAGMRRDAAHDVLVQRDLLRRIASFQAGVSLPLHALVTQCCAHDADFHASFSVMDAGHRLESLASVVARYGDLRLLQLTSQVAWYDDANTSRDYSVVDMPSALAVAVECDRVDMVQWLLARGTLLSQLQPERHNVWDVAVNALKGSVAIRDSLRECCLADLLPLWHRQELPFHLRGQHKHLLLVQWFHESIAEFEFACEWIEEAAARGDLEVVQYLLDHVGVLCTPRASYEAYSNRHIDIFFYLLEHGGGDADHGEQVERYAVQWGDLSILQLLQHKRRLRHLDGVNIDQLVNTRQWQVVAFLQRHVRTTCTARAMLNAVESRDLALVQFLHATRSEPWPSEAIDAAGTHDSIDVMQFLLEHGKEKASCTTQAMDSAAAWGRLDMVRFLHETRSEGCTTKAMDQAASSGDLAMVQFLHEHRSEGCTTGAMDGAACGGHLDVVMFLHAHRAEGCTTQAMHGAATSGHLDVVRFLHENRAEGCTATTMDATAGAGHLAVLQFLHDHRKEVCCTTRAMNMAASAGHIDVVRFLAANRSEGMTAFGVNMAIQKRHRVMVPALYALYPQHFKTRTVMRDLLLAGAFDVWQMMRDERAKPHMDSELTDDGVLDAMSTAGRTKNLATIQFLCDVMHRVDVVHVAMNGAATQDSVAWILRLHNLYPTSCRFSAVTTAIDQGGDDSIKLINALVWLCHDATRADAVAYAKQAAKFVTALKLEHAAYSAVEPDLDLEVALELSLEPFSDGAWRESEESAVHRAISGGQLEELQRIYRVSLYPEFVNDPRFSFRDARSMAVRWKQLEILKWLVTAVPLPIEPQLLDEALSYNFLETAEWLATHCPTACLEFSSDVQEEGYAPHREGLSQEGLMWVEAKDVVRAFVDFGAIAAYAASRSDLAMVKYLHETYPAAFLDRCDIMTRAKSVEVLLYLDAIGYPHPANSAMDGIIVDSGLDVVHYLHKHHPDACSSRALRDAAKYGALAIVKFHVFNRAEGDVDAAIETSGHLVREFLMVHKHYPECLAERDELTLPLRTSSSCSNR